MQEALKEAQKAYEAREVPIGAVVVEKNHIIARAHNQVELLNDATAHAEMLALTAAFGHRDSKYLPTCTLYVTLEPCLMCAAATYWTKLERLVFASKDKKRGYTLLQPTPLHPKTKVLQGVLQKESEKLLKAFFQKLRS